jgi:hypothetical protein
MAKRKQAKKAKRQALQVADAVATKAVKAKAPTKVGQVIALCERKSGCTIDDIVKELSVSKQAARSLIGDARRKGLNIKFDAATGSYHL